MELFLVFFYLFSRSFTEELISSINSIFFEADIFWYLFTISVTDSTSFLVGCSVYSLTPMLLLPILLGTTPNTPLYTSPIKGRNCLGRPAASKSES
jgi:hypothetical protein